MKTRPLSILLALLVPSLAVAGGITTDEVTLLPYSAPSPPACTSGRACIYAKAADSRVYIRDPAGLELQSNAARSIRVASDCTALASPAFGDVCYSSGLSAFQYYNTGGWTTGVSDNSTYVTLSGSQTLSNKTLSSPSVTGTVTSSVMPVARTTGGGTGALGTGTVYLTAPGQAPSSTEVYLALGTRSSKARNLFCYLSTAPGGSDTVVFTVRVAASNTSLTCTITGSGQTCNDTTDSASVVGGNGLSIKAVSSAGTAAGATCSFEETYS